MPSAGAPPGSGAYATHLSLGMIGSFVDRRVERCQSSSSGGKFAEADIAGVNTVELIREIEGFRPDVRVRWRQASWWRTLGSLR